MPRDAYELAADYADKGLFTLAFPMLVNGQVGVHVFWGEGGEPALRDENSNIRVLMHLSVMRQIKTELSQLPGHKVVV